MNDEDRLLLRETLTAVGGLKEDLGEFRGEMREFKGAMVDRVKHLEEQQERRQTNPQTCSTGRALQNHLRGEGAAKKNRLVVIGLVMSGLSLAAVVVTAIVKP